MVPGAPLPSDASIQSAPLLFGRGRSFVGAATRVWLFEQVRRTMPTFLSPFGRGRTVLDTAAQASGQRNPSKAAQMVKGTPLP